MSKYGKNGHCKAKGTFRTTKPALGAGFVVMLTGRDNFRTFCGGCEGD